MLTQALFWGEGIEEFRVISQKGVPKGEVWQEFLEKQIVLQLPSTFAEPEDLCCLCQLKLLTEHGGVSFLFSLAVLQMTCIVMHEC